MALRCSIDIFQSNIDDLFLCLVDYNLKLFFSEILIIRLDRQEEKFLVFFNTELFHFFDEFSEFFEPFLLKEPSTVILALER